MFNSETELEDQIYKVSFATDGNSDSGNGGDSGTDTGDGKGNDTDSGSESSHARYDYFSSTGL